MASNQADAGSVDGNGQQHSGGSLGIQIDEEQTPHLAQTTKVRFASPSDITSEQLTFNGSDGGKHISVEGIVEYGSAPDAADNSNKGIIVSRRDKSNKRNSSLELRKDIPNSLLSYDQNAITDSMTGSAINTPKARRKSKVFGKDGCLHYIFLNPSYSLRKQMLLAFGSVASLTILLVMIVSVAAAIVTGNAIKQKSETYVEEWVNESMSNTPQLVAEALSPKIMPSDLVDLMLEIAQDRFMGYPSTEDDSQTPFFDTKSQTNVYPLKNNPLPMDWDFRHTPNEREGNVNSENYEEHVQDRWELYSANPRLSTEISFYSMQGACDPRATNSSAMEYYFNCTDANNDVTTGGVVAPSPTNDQVYRKAADLSPFLKSLFEYHQDIKELGHFFSNSGAGSTIMFPHYELDSSSSYTSVGCDWMRAPNPIGPKLGSIGTEEEIARCHSKDTVVPTREYNPLERGWCREQALDPSRVHNYGPYLDAWNKNSWLMTVGRALYDPVTGAFICCTLVDFTMDVINRILEEVKVNELGTLSLVRNDDNGTVVTSPNFDFDTADSLPTVDDPTLKTGVDHETFEEIKSIFNFSQQWNPTKASRSFEAKRFDSGEHIISAYPIPSIPDQYDASYKPDFFAVFSLPKTKGIVPIVDKVNKQVGENVQNTILFVVLVGLGGLAAVILLILMTSYLFVEPLKWMHKVGEQVVGKFGEDLDVGIDYERKNALPCSPKTELSSLAEEFSKMITRFSGTGTARRMKINDTEKINVFDFSENFARLYRSREDSGFAFSYQTTLVINDAREGQSLKQCNFGPNTRLPSKKIATSLRLGATINIRKGYKSSLFLWMAGLIVTPFFVTTTVISSVVIWRISNELPSLIAPVRNEYLNLKGAYRFSAAGMLAIRASTVTEKAARDTHLLTRFASWLFFGGIETSGSSTEVIEGAEECKTALNETECEWLKETSCDCEWNDTVAHNKENSSLAYPSGRRSLQKVMFAAQSQDAGLDGSRNFTSYPEVATTPNTTAWWDNITVLPNVTEDILSSRYGSSYDRARIISALSTVFLPLYNYDKTNSKSLGTFIGFEADGMMAGYSGCNSTLAIYAFWRSTKDNGAADLRPELCPLNKYGYDPRCRSWYDDGKKKLEADNKTLHITAPYSFAEAKVVGQSITSPLLDPRNQKQIGQVLVDFLPNFMLGMLERDNTKLSNGGFSILITPESDVLGHDTVIGPGFNFDGDGRSIKDLVQADDAFELIIEKMKAGGNGTGTFFNTTNPDGQESINIAYAPVFVRNLHLLNSSQIASGVKKDTTLVYSLALAETEKGILDTFQSTPIDDLVSKTVNVCIGVLTALIGISIVLIVYIAFRVTTSMSDPILQLFGVMKDINGMHISNDDVANLSDYKGSCRELDGVYKTMEMLCKVMKFANIAFFAGDLELAYKVLKDAHRLFTRLGNKKAMAVVSNNLGNTMLTIYRTMTANGYEEMCGLAKRDIIEKGMAYFAQSIKLGEEAYDQFYNEQGWSEECLVFMQFLANRYFNRALFCLTTSGDHENKKGAESLGFRDLQITADMDVEIVDQCVEMGFKIDRVERYEFMMGRVRGLLALVELGYSPDELYIEDQITDVYQDLMNALKNPSHKLFAEVSATGRIQKLDVELMRYFSQAKHDNINAARVAIRMLIEDEYVFPDTEQAAIAMLLVYMKSTDDVNCPDDEDGHIAKELKSVIEALDRDHVRRSQTLSSLNNSSQISFNRIGSTSDARQKNASKASINIENNFRRTKSERRSSAARESCRGDVTMELF